jgi:hypothetical protein
MPSKIDLSYPKILDLFAVHAVTQRTESRQFLAWFLENYYRLELSEIDDCICDGNYDKGIDGIYVNDQLTQIDVFQSRIVKSNKTLGDVGLKEFKGSLDQFSDIKAIKNMQETTKNAELVGLLEEQAIAKKVAEGYRVRGIFLTNAKKDQNAIDFLKGAKELILYDANELQESYVPLDKTEPIATEIKFDVSAVPTMEYPIGTLNMVIAPLAAEELVNMEGIANGELFAWNVRQWLRKTKVNKDIAQSIQRQEEHKYFPAFHNGLTVLCKNLRVKNDKITVSGYAVVNGCQSLTGLYENRNRLSSDLRILTKFIQISPETPLALKITDHTNNQNGTTARDLQSNSHIQTRLQKEVNAQGYRYRIKRGEHLEWDDSEKVIENDLAARILLAFDLKQPWACHQTYRLFDELHADIFGRPDVNGIRVIATYRLYEHVIDRLDLFKNQLFARYTITRFLMLFLLREILETDSAGLRFCGEPGYFVKSRKRRKRFDGCMAKLTKVVVRLLDAEVNRRDGDVKSPFDYKRELKSPNDVRKLAGIIVSHYQLTVDSNLTPTFTSLWKKSKKKAK